MSRQRIVDAGTQGHVGGGRLVAAIDTATDVLAIGIGRLTDTGVEMLVSISEAAPRKANTVLLPRLAEELDAAGSSVRDIAAVVVGRGPGSFTGVRIGVVTAKGLAQGLAAPLYGVGTLDALAWRWRDRPGLLGVVGDAMRGEVYPALFRTGGGSIQRLAPDTVERPLEVAARWAEGVDEPILLAGNGLAKHAQAFADALGQRATFASADEWAVTGEGLLGVFAANLAAGEAGDGDTAALLPVYTRLSDAEENERVRAGAREAATPASGVAGGDAS